MKPATARGHAAQDAARARHCRPHGARGRAAALAAAALLLAAGASLALQEGAEPRPHPSGTPLAMGPERAATPHPGPHQIIPYAHADSGHTVYACMTDGTTPSSYTIAFVTSDGSYKAGDSIVIRVTGVFGPGAAEFSSDGDTAHIFPSTSIGLETGTIDRNATYTGKTETTADYTYVVQDGDSSADLDYKATNSLHMQVRHNGLSFYVLDDSQDIMDCLLPIPGAAGSLRAQGAIVIDTAAPLLQGVRAAVPDGTYAAGQRILVNASFSEAVVSRAPSLTLDVGGVDRVAEYLRGNNSATITFAYTVRADDDAGSLDYNATNAMAGPITDIAGNPADLALPRPGDPGSLSDTSDIVLRTAARAAYESSMSSGASTGLHGVAVGPDGTVYVARDSTHNILAFNSSGSYMYAIPGPSASASSDPGKFDQPVGVGVNRTGHIFAVDRANDRIQVFHPNGTFASAVAAPGLASPRDIDTDAAGRVYVLDRDAHHVRVLGPDGAAVRTIGSQGSGDGQVDAPHGVAVGPSGLVYVADSNNHRVQVFHPDGAPAFRFGTQGTAVGQLGYPYDVEVGPSGFVFVSERHNDRISVFNSTGSFVVSFGSAGTGAGQFGEIAGLAADPSGRILAADWARSDVQAFRLAHSGAPNVTSVSVRPGTAPPGGALGAGASVDIDAAFDAVVHVDTALSTPALLLETGGTDRQARYLGHSGQTISFRYEAQDGDATDRLSYVWEGALHPNGSSIAGGQGAGAAPAALRLPAPGSGGSLSDPAREAVAVDTVRPRVLSVTSPDDDGTYGTGATINITVRFSEGVEFAPPGTRPTIELDTGNAGAAGRHAACTPAESASAELGCAYTVREGDAAADLGYGAGAELDLGGGGGGGAAARDAAGNALLPALPDPASAASLGGSKSIALDTKLPEVLRVTSPDANGTYGRGDAIRVSVVFDGAVTIVPEPAAGSPSAPTLRLETGENDRAAAYAGGSGSSALEFVYTVIAGDSSADLNYAGTGALSLGSGASLVDEHGNEGRDPPALPDPASAASLGGQKDIVVRAAPAVDPAAAPSAASAEAVFAGPRTVRIDYTAPLGPPAGHEGAVYGSVTIGDGGGAGSAAPSGVSGLGTHTHIVRLEGDAAGRGQNGTIRLLADLEGAANGTLYAFTDDAIPVRAGEDAHTLAPPAAEAHVAAIESDGFVRVVNATAAGDGARPAINVSGLPSPAGLPPRGSGAVMPHDHNVTLIASFAEVSFPPGATASPVPADGLLKLYVSPRPPTAQGVADGFGVPADGVEVLLVVEAGDNATRIEFDMPVRILLVGQADGRAFYVNGTGGGGGPAVVPIAAECAAGDTFAAAHARLGGSGECWLNSGADKVIYTYHLTRFGAADIPPPMCAAVLEPETVELGAVAAGGQSDAAAQRIASAGTLRLAAVSVGATDWTREGGGGGFGMPANATQVRTGGSGAWTPLEGALPVALEADGQSASVQFRLAVPADALGGGPSGVPALQTVTYTVECAAPAG